MLNNLCTGETREGGATLGWWLVSPRWPPREKIMGCNGSDDVQRYCSDHGICVDIQALGGKTGSSRVTGEGTQGEATQDRYFEYPHCVETFNFIDIKIVQ